jgi:prepilin-type N-terminal cleavage/methylation domain-containing protein
MKRGFTLIELIIVVVILGILALIALPRYAQLIERSKMSEAFGSMNTIQDAERLYYTVNASYKTSFPIEVDPDPNYAGDEVTVRDPNSPTFTYGITTGAAGASYISATKKGTSALHSYYMCIESAKTSMDGAPACP